MALQERSPFAHARRLGALPGFRRETLGLPVFAAVAARGLQAPAKFAQMTYAHDGDGLYVNFLMSADVNWREKGVVVRQTTRFPDEDETTLEIAETASPTVFSLNLRVAKWMTAGSVSIRVNGERVPFVEEDGYARIRRVWRAGDRVKLSFEPELQVVGLPAGDEYLALLYGPVLLGAPMGMGCYEKKDFALTSPVVVINRKMAISDVPPLFGSRAEIKRRMTRKPGDRLAFEYKSDELGAPVELIPFSDIHFQCAAVYFPHVRPALR